MAISEGTALHYLAERAIAWQKKARDILNNVRGVVEEARGQQLRMGDLRKKIAKWKQEVSAENKDDPSADILQSQAGK